VRLLIAAERAGSAGGMERYLAIVLPALVARGAEVRVIARECDAAADGSSINIQRIVWAAEREPPDVRAAEATRRAIEAFAPDVAVAHNVMDAGVVEALRSVPRLAYHIHDHRPFCPNGDRVYPRSRINCRAPLGAACVIHALLDGCAYGPRPRTLALIGRRRRLRDAIAKADAAIVTSRYVRDRAVSSGVPAERLVTLPPPLPDDAFATEPRASQTPPSIAFAGRMVPQKGLLALVRAIATIPSEMRPQLHALGDGPELPEVRETAARAGVALAAPGTGTSAEVREAIDAATLTAVPSLWAEPFGYVGIESLARGRAVVAFDTGGIGEWLIDGRNGRAVAAGDEAALARALEELLADGALRGALELRARADAEAYRAAPIVERLLKVYLGGG
jgi:glycosyltransferase involved in cell wall biosynthesis